MGVVCWCPKNVRVVANWRQNIGESRAVLHDSWRSVFFTNNPVFFMQKLFTAVMFCFLISFLSRAQPVKGTWLGAA
jgi:hypothetical protein